MSDLFAPLRDVEPVPAPSPEEVRRRGDRLRRRRAGLEVVGAVCAVAITVGGGYLVTGSSPGSDSSRGPVDAPGVESAIPAVFDLADGLPRESLSSDLGTSALTICGETSSLTELATASEGIGYASRGDFTARGLSVYPDTGTAEAVATDLVAEFESCPRFTDRRGRTWTTSIRPTSYGDQGWVVARFRNAPGPNPDFPEAIQMVRLGASLLVVQQREVHGIRLADLARGTGDQVESLMHRQMCLLTDRGCAWRSDPDVLRPDGWGPLRLGMSRDEVEATGMAEISGAGACRTVDLETGAGRLSGSDELVSLDVPEGVTTPDGIGVGSSRDDVLERYPFAEPATEGMMRVRASPVADYVLTVDRGQVTRLALWTVGEECAG
jgi:hypothetical protein